MLNEPETLSPRHLQSIDSPRQQADRLRAELQTEQQELVEAEAALANEQAAVNAFRMHARLMLDDLADAVQALLSEKQSLLTRLALLRQEGNHLAGEADEEAPSFAEPDPIEEAFPTPTPHDKAAEKRLYRELARRFHPDLAETAVELAYRTSVMTAVNAAYSSGDTQALYDLAGELEPGELRELALIPTTEIRRLQERLMQCRRRRRKVQRQLETLRQDNTARLYRRAMEMNSADEDWWTAVRRDLVAARNRLAGEIASLAEELAALEPIQD
jgi:chromosome segregation ATPase